MTATPRTRKHWTPQDKAVVLWQLDEARRRGIRAQGVLDAHGAYTSLVAGWRRTPEKWPALTDDEQADAAQLLDALDDVTGGVPTLAPPNGRPAAPASLLEAENEYLRAQVDALTHLVERQRAVLAETAPCD